MASLAWLARLKDGPFILLWKGMAKYIFEEGVVLHVNSKAYVYATFGNERARQQ